MSLAFAAALLLQAAPTAPTEPAPQWEAFHRDGGNSFEVDPNRLSRDGDQVEAWVRQVYAEPAPPFGMKSFVLHNRVDCRRRRAVTYSMEGFLEDGTSLGRMVYPENQRPNERVSRSGGDGAMLRRVCGDGAE